MKPINNWSKNEKMQFLDNIRCSEDRFYTDYTEELTYLLKDPDPEIRADIIEILWDMPERVYLTLLRELSENDPDQNVRIQAIAGLGRYMYELDALLLDGDDLFSDYEEEEITKEDLFSVKEFLISLYLDPEKPIEERQHAFFALSFLDDEQVIQFIREAYNSNEESFKIMAIAAMGRNGNSDWENIVLQELSSKNKEMQIEAIRAAAELDIEKAYKILLQLTYSIDKDIMLQAILALGKSGCSEAFERLDELAMSSDDDVKEMAETALDEWYMASEEYDDEEYDDDDE
ncbi:MAG: HEAT repeat domain-containing protein [Spirochaetales bacterium]|nr:HEAT repeat domain-containing protein [Spirochaetales bacterium]